MTWIVDSSVWIAAFNGVASRQTLMLRERIGADSVALGDLILVEVLQGFRSHAEYGRARRHLQDFPIYAMGGTMLALHSADNYRLLRQRGITVRSTIDCIIATFCIEHEFALLTLDRDFEPFAALLGLAFAE